MPAVWYGYNVMYNSWYGITTVWYDMVSVVWSVVLLQCGMAWAVWYGRWYYYSVVWHCQCDMEAGITTVWYGMVSVTWRVVWT